MSLNTRPSQSPLSARVETQKQRRLNFGFYFQDSGTDFPRSGMKEGSRWAVGWFGKWSSWRGSAVNELKHTETRVRFLFLAEGLGDAELRQITGTRRRTWPVLDLSWTCSHSVLTLLDCLHFVFRVYLCRLFVRLLTSFISRREVRTMQTHWERDSSLRQQLVKYLCVRAEYAAKGFTCLLLKQLRTDGAF